MKKEGKIVCSLKNREDKSERLTDLQPLHNWWLWQGEKAIKKSTLMYWIKDTTH